MVDIIRQSTVRVDHIEDRLLANRISGNRNDLGSLRRVLVRLQRLLAPEPAEEFSLAVNDSAALVERIKILQEEIAAFVNEQTNRTLFILTIVTVMALPINMVAGLFGMNVGGIPLANHGSGFFWIVGILLALTALLAYISLGSYRDKNCLASLANKKSRVWGRDFCCQMGGTVTQTMRHYCFSFENSVDRSETAKFSNTSESLYQKLRQIPIALYI